MKQSDDEFHGFNAVFFCFFFWLALVTPARGKGESRHLVMLRNNYPADTE
jgi:hypothetical protein